MELETVELLARDLLLVLAAGFLAGLVCQRLKVSLIIGYLLVGAVIGTGGLGLVSQGHHELEILARAGILLLLFAIGIEFSLEELVRLSRYFFLGGSVQMALVTLGATLACLPFLPWRTAVLLGAALSLSSTVLVFRALAEVGESASPHGKRAIGILLFQDAALVPLMLLLPLLSGGAEGFALRDGALLAGKSVAFVAMVVALRSAMQRWGVPILAATRSRELVVVFTVVLVVGCSLATGLTGLSAALGAFAAGLVLSGNRLTSQIDALVLPYREVFAVIFFVTLGTLMRPALLLESPLLVAGTLAGVLALKTVAACIALMVTGLPRRAAFGMGMGLAQLGEFAFVLFLEARRQGGMTEQSYQVMLLVGLGSLVLTPLLVRRGLAFVEKVDDESEGPGDIVTPMDRRMGIVIGAGPVGRQVSSQLECMGIDISVVDLSPVNLHEFELLGIRTVAGDARDRATLRLAGVTEACLVVVAVPVDDVALEVVKQARRMDAEVPIVVRCRFQETQARLMRAGASEVVSEEVHAARAIIHYLTRLRAV
jgi:CPA2 family monovalent cation:H+ antiporter-2